MTNKYYIELDNKYSTSNYAPTPVVLERGEGVFLWDVEGNKYYDFLSAYSAVNQGHCNKKIKNVLIEQSSKLTLTSRAFFTKELALYQEYICKKTGYDRVLPMNSGVEATETAFKLARKWGYKKKGIKEDDAIIIFPKNNFHGRTITAVSASTDSVSKKEFGPLLKGIKHIEYNNIKELEVALENKNVAAFMLEPIQGEAGVIVPNDGYLKKAYELCKSKNVLFICDEIQTGLGRTGKLFAHNYENIKPDIITLGKALSGGFMPISAILGTEEAINILKPGEHGSTYGGNPLACAIAKEAFKIIVEEKLPENAYNLGIIFRDEMKKMKLNSIKEIRGKGLLNAIEIKKDNKYSAKDVCMELLKLGLLAKPTHVHTIRFAPPLIISKNQLLDCCNIIKQAFKNLEEK